MSRDVIKVGSTMWIPLLYRVSLAGAQNAPPTLKDLKFWTAEEKKNRKFDHLARSLLIQGLLNDIYSLIDSNETAKDLWDALERQMRGFEYAEQDRKATILYEYETFQATEEDKLLDTYLRYLQMINDLKKCGYKKDNCELNYKFLNNLQLEWKQYDPLALVVEKTKVSKRKEKVEVQSESEESDDEDITSSSTKKKPEYVKSVEKKEDKRADEKKREMSKVKCYNCKKEGHFAKDCKKAKVRDYNYYKTKMLLAKKDSDEQVLLVVDQAWMESSDSSLSAEEIIAEAAYYTSESESESEYETSEYYDNSTNYGLFVNDNDDQEIFHDAIESGSENFIENHIESQKDYDKSEVDQNNSEEKEHLVNKLIWKFNHKIVKCQKHEVVSLLEKEKANMEIIKSLKSKGFETSENAISKSENQSENNCKVVEKECDQVENSKVIAPGMFNINVSQSVSPISISKKSCDSKNVKNKTKRKRRKGKSSKQNDKQVNNDVSRANSDFVHFSDLDTFSSVRRPKQSSVIWKKKGSSNTSNVDLSSVSHSKLNKDVKRYSCKDLLSCNNSHLGETSSVYVCNDAMNVFCNSRLCDSFDENNLFIFNDESVIISPVSKMPFRKKPRDSMNMRSKSNSNKSLPRTMHRWLPKMQPLAKPVAKWILRVERNRALLKNFMGKFLGTVRFGNNDFTVIAGYGDVVIGSMTIKKVYYVEGLGHNLFSVGQFFDKGLEVAFRKSTCFVRNEDG
nr:integrase, catalytic region, zinc finger, CCHC-type, peptidase aspartic, catalytic [Tanacetum cinerariifolium]